jgi:hypothetical protein
MDKSRETELEKVTAEAVNQREQLLLRAKNLARKTEERVRRLLIDRTDPKWPRGVVTS